MAGREQQKQLISREELRLSLSPLVTRSYERTRSVSKQLDWLLTNRATVEQQAALVEAVLHHLLAIEDDLGTLLSLLASAD